MEPYKNPNKPSAKYVFSSYLFYYKKSQSENDVSIEEITAPSKDDMNSRNNPVCNFSIIKIKNNGNSLLTDLKINYGIVGEKENLFNWTGELRSTATKEISLPEIFDQNDSTKEFKVTLSEPNGEIDEYAYDNSLSATINLPPVFDPKLIIIIKTNNEAAHNFYQFINERGIVFNKHKTGSLENNNIYRDTVSLSRGCYEFVFGDTANDGLDFWFNPEGGYGYVRITDINGKLIKAFNSDFGKEIRQPFIVTGNPVIREDITPILNIFPIRNPGKFFCDIFLNEKQNFTLQITTEDKKKIVYEKKIKKFKEGTVDINISKQTDGYYFVNVINNGKTVSKKIKVKRDK
jgi:hypothetical protein